MACSFAVCAPPSGLISPLCSKNLSSKSSLCSRLPCSPTPPKPFIARTTTCSLTPSDNHEQTSSPSSSLRESAGKIAAAIAMAAVMSTAPMSFFPEPAMADVAGLTPCKESKAFAKRQKQELKKLQGRLNNYAPDSAPALAINATMEKTKRRFEFYGNAGLLCGTDGLPHLIVDGDQAHLGEFVYPGIIFLYIAGWIGWVGRSYLIEIRSVKKPTQKEIIIDVPLASRLLWRGFIWPLAAISEFRNGKLLEDASNITVSPR